MTAAMVLMVLSATAGQVNHDSCPTIPTGAIPAPPGTFLHQWQSVQIANAQADAFVIYRNEWCPGGTMLGPYGRYHLGKIVKHLGEVPFPVVIQPDLDDTVNA